MHSMHCISTENEIRQGSYIREYSQLPRNYFDQSNALKLIQLFCFGWKGRFQVEHDNLLIDTVNFNILLSIQWLNDYTTMHCLG